MHAMANAKNGKKRKKKPTEDSPKTPSRKSAQFTSAPILEAAGLSDPDLPLTFPTSPTPVEPMDTTLADEDLQEILDDPEASSTDLYTTANSDSDNPTDTIIQPKSTLNIKLSSLTIHNSSSSETITDLKHHPKQSPRKKKGVIELDDDEEENDEIHNMHHSMFFSL